MTVRRGLSLLEVVVALALAGTAGSAFLQTGAEALRGLDSAGGADRRLETAQEVMSTLSVLTRRELEGRLGTRESHGLIVRVTRPASTLFRLSVSQSAETELLVTIVFRAEALNGW